MTAGDAGEPPDALAAFVGKLPTTPPSRLCKERVGAADTSQRSFARSTPDQ